MHFSSSHSAISRLWSEDIMRLAKLKARRAVFRRTSPPLRSFLFRSNVLPRSYKATPGGKSFTSAAFGTLRSLEPGKEECPSKRGGLSVPSHSQGVLQLPGVRTPEDLLLLARRCIADCEELLSLDTVENVFATENNISDEASNERRVTEAVRRMVHQIDAVSNALCKVADAAEFLRQVHEDESWKMASATVVGEVQRFMSKANLSQSVYGRLRRADTALKELELQRNSSETNSTADGLPSLSTEEKQVLRCMRICMEQHGAHLSLDEKEKHLALLEGEAESGARCLDCEFPPPAMEVSTRRLLQSGVPPQLIRSALEEAQSDSEKENCNGRFLWGLWRRRRPADDKLRLSSGEDLATAVMRFSNDADLRASVFSLTYDFDDREADLQFLKLVALRQTLAKERGFTSWAEFSQREGVLKSPFQVSLFIDRIEESLGEKVETELAELNDLSKRLLGEPLKSTDFEFLSARLLEERTSPEVLHRQPLFLSDFWKEAVTLAADLIDCQLEIDAASADEAWHPSVLRCSLRERANPDLIRGTLYLDLWRRPGKHAPLAQFSIRGSKKMNFQLSQGWLPGGQSLSEAGVFAFHGIHRQVPCCALVAELSGDDRINGAWSDGALELWKRGKLREDEAVQLFHEIGHCMHALLSNTEMQHFSGTRGAVDFTEFPSHLFELAGQTLLRRREERGAEQVETPAPLGALTLCQQLSLALLDRVRLSQRFNNGAALRFGASPPKSASPFGSACLQALHEFQPSEAFVRKVQDQIVKRRHSERWHPADETDFERELQDSELNRLRVHLNAYFDSRRLLGLRVLSAKTPLWRVLGRVPLRRFPHLVHYGGTYFCYLFCRATAALTLQAWREERGLEARFARDSPLANREQRQRLKALLSRGSSDCSIDVLLSLLPNEGSGSLDKILLSRQPEMLPLKPLLKEAGVMV